MLMRQNRAISAVNGHACNAGTTTSRPQNLVIGQCRTVKINTMIGTKIQRRREVCVTQNVSQTCQIVQRRAVVGMRTKTKIRHGAAQIIDIKGPRLLAIVWIVRFVYDGVPQSWDQIVVGQKKRFVVEGVVARDF